MIKAWGYKGCFSQIYLGENPKRPVTGCMRYNHIQNIQESLPAQDLFGRILLQCHFSFHPDCDLQVPAFREIAKNYLKRVRGEENQNEHSDDEETETRADEK